MGSRGVFLAAADADIVDVRDFPEPAPVVWDWLNDPVKRSQWMTGHNWTLGPRPAGRTGVGARNHCVHGKSTTIETILDWRPFDYVSTEQLVNGNILSETVQLEPLPTGGTRMHTHMYLAVS